MTEWIETHLGDCVEINPETLTSRYKGTINYVDISSVDSGKLLGYTEYDIKDAPSRAKRVIRKGDIVYSTVRPNLRAYYYVKSCPDNAICSTGFVVLRAKENTNSRFIYSLVTENSFINWLSAVAKGSAYPAVDSADFKSAKIKIPDIGTQNRISDILSAYDDLIENNLARISLLEKMASELYKEWFVRFRFPGHEAAKFVDGVPEGWEMRKLKELIEFDPLIRMKKGVEYRTIPMDLLSTDSMLIDTSGCEKTTSTSGAHFQNGDTLLARITPCLENGKTGFVNTLDDGETAVGSTEFIVMRSKLLSPHLVYFIARSEYFRKTAINSMNGADGRQRAKISKLQSLSYPLPTRDIIDEFSEIVEPFFEEIKNLNIQNHNLTKQRDLLLPRLMSGKLSVEPLLGQTA